MFYDASEAASGVSSGIYANANRLSNFRFYSNSRMAMLGEPQKHGHL